MGNQMCDTTTKSYITVMDTATQTWAIVKHMIGLTLTLCTQCTCK